MLQGKELRDTCLGSATAGMISKFVCHPIDTAKARLQMPDGAAFRGTAHILRATLANEGIPGLYRGIGAVMVGGIPGTSLYFTTYEATKDLLVKRRAGAGGELNFLGHFTAGMLAEVVCCVVFVPCDVIKERLQVQRAPKDSLPTSGGPSSYRGSGDALRTIMRTEGLGGIYKGYGATLASFGPFSALYFTFYEQAKALSQNMLYERRRKAREGGRDAGVGGRASSQSSRDGEGGRESSGNLGEIPVAITLVNAATAAAAASWLTNPLDMAKLRLQVQRGNQAGASSSAEIPPAVHGIRPFSSGGVPQVRYRGFLDALAHIYREGGVARLFKGSGARMAYHAPSTAIAMAIFEKAKGAWGSLLQ